MTSPIQKLASLHINCFSVGNVHWPIYLFQLRVRILTPKNLWTVSKKLTSSPARSCRSNCRIRRNESIDPAPIDTILRLEIGYGSKGQLLSSVQKSRQVGKARTKLLSGRVDKASASRFPTILNKKSMRIKSNPVCPIQISIGFTPWYTAKVNLFYPPLKHTFKKFWNHEHSVPTWNFWLSGVNFRVMDKVGLMPDNLILLGNKHSTWYVLEASELMRSSSLRKLLKIAAHCKLHKSSLSSRLSLTKGGGRGIGQGRGCLNCFAHTNTPIYPPFLSKFFMWFKKLISLFLLSQGASR